MKTNLVPLHSSKKAVTVFTQMLVGRVSQTEYTHLLYWVNILDMSLSHGSFDASFVSLNHAFLIDRGSLQAVQNSLLLEILKVFRGGY